MIKPVFYDGELVAFVACIGHMTEVGGKVPGGFAGDATEVFQEGIRIPPVKIVEGGRDVEAVWNIILANVRTPRISYGDMKAMIGSLYVGERRIVELVDEARRGALPRRSRRRSRTTPSAACGRRSPRCRTASTTFEDYVIDNDGDHRRAQQAAGGGHDRRRPA